MVKFNKVRLLLLVFNLTLILLIVSNTNLKGKPGFNFVAATLGEVCEDSIGSDAVWSIDPTILNPDLIPPPQTNVFVKEELVWILECGNYLAPARLRIEIW